MAREEREREGEILQVFTIIFRVFNALHFDQTLKTSTVHDGLLSLSLSRLVPVIASVYFLFFC